MGTKDAVYRAEQNLRKMLDTSIDCPTVQIYGSTVTLPIERKFASIDSVQSYVDKVLALNWVRQKWTQARVGVTVKSKRAQGTAHYVLNTINLPVFNGNKAWAMREIIVLHELSHHLDNSQCEDSHGPTFQDVLITLVTEIVGCEAGFILQSLIHEELSTVKGK